MDSRILHRHPGLRHTFRSGLYSGVMSLIAVAIAFVLLQDKPAVQAARPQRTEAEARARAEENRRKRAEERRKTGAPVELIADYLAAVVRPVPAELGVSAFYRK